MKWSAADIEVSSPIEQKASSGNSLWKAELNAYHRRRVEEEAPEDG